MNTTRDLKRVIAGALLSVGVAVAGLGLASGTAKAFDPQPEPPTKPIAARPEVASHPNPIAVNRGPELPGVQNGVGAKKGPAPSPGG